MKREEKIAIKILKFKYGNIFSKLKIINYKIKKMKYVSSVDDEKQGSGKKYRVTYTAGANWFNPLTYLALIVVLVVEVIQSAPDFFSGLTKYEVTDYINIKDE